MVTFAMAAATASSSFRRSAKPSSMRMSLPSSGETASISTASLAAAASALADLDDASPSSTLNLMTTSAFRAFLPPANADRPFPPLSSTIFPGIIPVDAYTGPGGHASTTPSTYTKRSLSSSLGLSSSPASSPSFFFFFFFFPGFFFCPPSRKHSPYFATASSLVISKHATGRSASLSRFAADSIASRTSPCPSSVSGTSREHAVPVFFPRGMENFPEGYPSLM
mmetsp:Transcript_3906/g.10750  ORF Transcript_3906/g.10750 Transcript_3906/m.10750 type:complete len:224 (+) Transcript_3906:1538-2209(+)